MPLREGKNREKRFIFLEHTADIKFQAFGKTLNKAFENSALALKEVISGKLKVKARINKKIKAEGRDNEALLYRFLEQFLYLLDAENFLFSKIKKIKISDGKLEAEISGDLASEYKFTNDVKAVTYNQMFVKQEEEKETGKRFICQVVLDV